MKEGKMKYTYDEMFQRNIGIFTKEEQERIKNLKVAIAGAGGLGGPIAYNFARLGVGEIRLADPDKFEVSNINRQSGAYIDTIGEFKSEAIKREILRINPYIKVVTVNERLTLSNLDLFLEGASFVIDGIDFFALEDEINLHKRAREKGLWVFTCQGANNITSFLSFCPKRSAIEYFVCNNGVPDVGYAIKKMFPILPDGADSGNIDSFINKSPVNGLSYIPSYSVISPFNGCFVAEEAIKVSIRGCDPVAIAPNLFIFDLKDMKSKFFKNN